MRQHFWYIGTQYSKYLGGLGAACTMACVVAADLMRAGVSVYSPIAHSHNVAFRGGLDPYDYKIWQPANEPLMRAAHGMIVYRTPRWEDSVGIRREIEFFSARGRPIVYLDPGTLLEGEVLAQLRDIP